MNLRRFEEEDMEEMFREREDRQVDSMWAVKDFIAGHSSKFSEFMTLDLSGLFIGKDGDNFLNEDKIIELFKRCKRLEISFNLLDMSEMVLTDEIVESMNGLCVNTLLLTNTDLRKVPILRNLFAIDLSNDDEETIPDISNLNGSDVQFIGLRRRDEFDINPVLETGANVYGYDPSYIESNPTMISISSLSKLNKMSSYLNSLCSFKSLLEFLQTKKGKEMLELL
jgi:hypothetical protein